MAKVVIFSGAGISSESGISTFRDADGLWENYKIEDVCTKGCLDKNREMTIKFYDMLRVALREKEPNYAHKKIAELKNKYSNDIAVITQNVDDLFERGGCSDVLHVHGFLKQIRCEECDYIEDIGYTAQYEVKENCPICKSHLRPDIVFFHEAAPKYQNMFLELDDCEMFVVIGTSGMVLNMEMLIGGKMSYTILNNLEPSKAIKHKKFSKVIFKEATKAINEIADDIENFLN